MLYTFVIFCLKSRKTRRWDAREEEEKELALGDAVSREKKRRFAWNSTFGGGSSGRSRKRVGLCARRRSSGAESTAPRVTDQPNSGARRVIGLGGPSSLSSFVLRPRPAARPSDPPAIYPNNTHTKRPVHAFRPFHAEMLKLHAAYTARRRQGTLKGHALAAPSPPRTISRGQSVLCAFHST
jgi:hypothetical protein